MGSKPTVTKEFEADDNVMRNLSRISRRGTQRVRYSEVDMSGNLDWVKRGIRQEVLASNFPACGEGFKVQLEADPQVAASRRGHLWQARALYQNVRKIVAQRASGNLDQP